MATRTSVMTIRGSPDIKKAFLAYEATTLIEKKMEGTYSNSWRKSDREEKPGLAS